MKIFLSYRRDDTAGRAGRLFDLLVGRFGARSVFQDVVAVQPGADFTVQVDAAIEASDVMLVVIGPRWLEVENDSVRRIERVEDPVREEVRRALASTIPVVPVLVDGATLPRASQLPDDIAPLVLRQSAVLRDESWHDDVERLLRRLEGDHRIATRRRPRWPFAAAVVLLAATFSTVLFVVRHRADGSSDDALPSCESLDGLTTIKVAGEGAHLVDNEDGRREYQVQRAWQATDPAGGDVVVVQVAVTNVEASTSGRQSLDVHDYWFPAVRVDGIVGSNMSCWGPTQGELNIAPGEKFIAKVGFESDSDVSGKDIYLKLPDDGEILISRAG